MSAKRDAVTANVRSMDWAAAAVKRAGRTVLRRLRVVRRRDSVCAAAGHGIMRWIATIRDRAAN